MNILLHHMQKPRMSLCQRKYVPLEQNMTIIWLKSTMTLLSYGLKGLNFTIFHVEHIWQQLRIKKEKMSIGMLI